MVLIIILTIVCFVTAFSNLLSKPVKEFLKKPSSQEKRIQKEIAVLRGKLAKISMQSDYITYVKTERQIVNLQKDLNDSKTANIVWDLIINYGVGYGIQAVFSLLLVILSIAFRRDPVLIFEKKFNFAPFGGIMSFPTDIDGAISVPFWIFISSFTFRSIASYYNL